MHFVDNVVKFRDLCGVGSTLSANHFVPLYIQSSTKDSNSGLELPVDAKEPQPCKKHGSIQWSSVIEHSQRYTRRH